jgi:hypothetical protein
MAAAAPAVVVWPNTEGFTVALPDTAHHTRLYAHPGYLALLRRCALWLTSSCHATLTAPMSLMMAASTRTA